MKPPPMGLVSGFPEWLCSCFGRAGASLATLYQTRGGFLCRGVTSAAVRMTWNILSGCGDGSDQLGSSENMTSASRNGASKKRHPLPTALWECLFRSDAWRGAWPACASLSALRKSQVANRSFGEPLRLSTGTRERTLPTLQGQGVSRGRGWSGAGARGVSGSGDSLALPRCLPWPPTSGGGAGGRHRGRLSRPRPLAEVCGGAP